MYGNMEDVIQAPTPERHQSQLHPSANKFHIGNGDDGKHYWLTPPELYDKLNDEFGPFDFDPCPYPKDEDFDGLTCEWGKRNYVNPPFGSIMHNGKKKGPTAWMRKAILEQSKGKLSVVVYPVDKWVLMMLKATGAANIRNLGDVRWHAIEDGSQGKGTGRHIAAFVLHPVTTQAQRRRRLVNKTLPPCDHDECGLTRCEREAKPPFAEARGSARAWQCNLGNGQWDHDWQEKHDSSGEVDGGPGDHWSWRECRVCGEIEAPNLK